MELEFDKEIDAILRKARAGVAVASSSGPHLDADAIAAFAENALPDKAKLLYVEHFADCDACRKQLSFVIQTNKEAAMASSAPVAEPVTEASIPWYQSLFKAPNLSFAMGVLVLAFSGILGYLVMQKQIASDSATVSQVTEPDHGQPIFNRQNEASNAANVSAPANIAPATNTAANSASLMSGRGPNAEPETFGRVDSDQTKPANGSENNYQLDGASGGADAPPAKSAAAPPPPPVTTDSTSSGIAMERDEKKPVDGGKLKEESQDLELAKKQGEDRGYRDMPRAASKVGPSRGAGPVQMNQSNQMNSNMPVTRIVGGKTFYNRDGAWYDSAYQNQTTANFRRGTTEYKKLDSGLRNIADTLGGMVIVVWKAKAYRIQ